MKIKYMHLLGGSPASFSKRDGHLIIQRRIRLCDTLKQLKAEKEADRAYARKHNLIAYHWNYILIQIDD